MVLIAQLVERARVGRRRHLAPSARGCLRSIHFLALELLSGEQPGADHAGLRAGLRRAGSVTRSTSAGRARGRGLLAARSRNRSRRLGEAAADHDVARGSKVLIAPDRPTPRYMPSRSSSLRARPRRRRGPPPPRRGRGRCPVASPRAGGRGGESGRSLRELRGVALERHAAAERLEAAPGWGTCRGSRGRPSGSRVAQLGAEAGGAAEDPAVDHHAAAHAGAERVHDEVARPARPRRSGPRPARRSWRRCRRSTGTPRRLRAPRPADALERDVHARHDRARREVDLRGQADADRRSGSPPAPSPRATPPRSPRAAPRRARAGRWDAPPRRDSRPSTLGRRDLRAAHVDADALGRWSAGHGAHSTGTETE